MSDVTGQTDPGQNYAVYLTEAEGGQPAGTVVNCIQWDGKSDLEPQPGQAFVADPAMSWPIGSLYVAPGGP
jgi:hypothetical protein